MQKKSDVQQEITDKIIKELEAGCAPWVKPWHGGASFDIPVNVTTQNRYHGINIMLLWMAAQDRSFSSQRWLTYKQAKAVGGHVRKGEVGSQIFFFTMAEKEDEDGETRNIPIPRSYTVFNVSQCEDLPADYYAKPILKPVGIDSLKRQDLQNFASQTGATINHGGNSAFFNIAGDFVQMPEIKDFKSESGYWATLLHELGHWTGSPQRLDRTYGKKFGDQAYAREELVAELTSAFLCASLGVEGEMRHASYIESWLAVLRSDKKAIFKAASFASKAMAYLEGEATTKLEIQAA